MSGAMLCLQALFQSLERLEKEKVDKEELVLEIDVVRCQSIPVLCSVGRESGRARTSWCSAISPSQKADRAALAGKVSCAQFDAAMEQLNGMIGEMLSKVTGQEQDWHQVQQKLIEELDSKVQGGSSPPQEEWAQLGFEQPTEHGHPSCLSPSLLPPSGGADGDAKALCPPPVGSPGVGPAAAAAGGALEEHPEAAQGENTAGGG